MPLPADVTESKVEQKQGSAAIVTQIEATRQVTPEISIRLACDSPASQFWDLIIRSSTKTPN